MANPLARFTDHTSKCHFENTHGELASRRAHPRGATSLLKGLVQRYQSPPCPASLTVQQHINNHQKKTQSYDTTCFPDAITQSPQRGTVLRSILHAMTWSLPARHHCTVSLTTRCSGSVHDDDSDDVGGDDAHNNDTPRGVLHHHHSV